MAADDPVIFTEKDYELLKEMAADYLVSRNKSPNRPFYPERKPQAPEVYLAHVGAGGLPAYSPGTDSGTGTGTDILDDTFGSAECSTWRRLDGGKVVEIGRNLTVYNLTLTDIPQGSWILVVRDKSGTWWHDGGVGGAIEDYPLDTVSNVCLVGGTLTVEHTVIMALSGEVLSTYCITNPSDCCPIASTCCPGTTIARTLCLRVSEAPYDTRDADEWTLTYDSTNNRWQHCFVRDSVVLCWRLDCQVDGTWNLSQMTSGGISQVLCAKASSVTCTPFRLTFDSIADPTKECVVPATGRRLAATVIEGDCGSVGTGTGTGTGGGGGTGTVSTPCCSAGLPTFLYLTITDVAGCACVAGTYQLAWDGTKWTFFGEGICGGLNFNASLLCSFGSWVLSVACELSGSTVTWTGTVGAACTFPIGLTNLSGIQSGSGPWCCTGNVSLTITE